MAKKGAISSKIKQERKLLRFAARSLRVRYQRILDEMEYWDKVHTSGLLEEYAKQFSGIKRELGVEAQKKMDDDESVPTLRTALNDFTEFEDEIDNGIPLQTLPQTLATFKEWADYLAPSDSDQATNLQVNWWVYFRTALEQRMVPQYRYFLERVDIIARDCYYPLLIAVEKLIKETLEEHQGWLSPMTVLEFGEFYRTLSSRFAPIPYIFIPFDRFDNVWNLCAVHHEVAHDFYHKLNLFEESVPLIQDDSSAQLPPVARRFQENVKHQMGQVALTEAEKVVAEFIKPEVYRHWLEEIFADMIGIMLAGPIYIRSLQEILVDDDIIAFSKKDYPSTFLRILINVIFVTGKLKYLNTNVPQEDEMLELLSRWLGTFSRETATVTPLSSQENRDLQNSWFDGSSSKQDFVLQALHRATAELVQQMKDNRIKLLDKEKKKFNIFHKESETDEIVNRLTAVGLMGWLIKLVNVIWEAKLTSGGMSLQRINDRMECMEYQRLFQKDTEDRDQLHPNQRKKLRDAIETDIRRAAESLKGREYATCEPRYLVPAARLAFEESVLQNKEILQETRIRQFFMDSLHERSEVSNKFKRLSETAEKNWEEHSRRAHQDYTVMQTHQLVIQMGFRQRRR
ncbi:MAG: hypothetical protein JXM69_11040 [Anaerolineae bacterium]|nr:hypothetical protein [Anaerolineae bacterium]